ncbi:hypothetical protein DM02DRAFT_675272 [Periconia macrospinosa]|uniref:Uncharacterized protein n=1 Tax=Periconia macrospinosa TaxID=97972 RepID=A0A2V1DC76_9PLEO|nr:hypothetical protein DM02DRAFT_675272 [Periconia macrospinosa]
MMLLTTTALSWYAALAAAIPHDASKINLNRLTDAPAAIPASKLSLTNNSKTDEVTALWNVPQECIFSLFEKPNYKGQAWCQTPMGMGYHPPEAACTFVPAGLISSIRFEKDHWDRRAFSCYIYTDSSCGDAHDGNSNWIGDSQPDLKRIGGWDKRIGSMACYWNTDGKRWKRDTALATRGPYDHAMELFQNVNFDGWYMFYTRAMLDREECMSDIPIGVSSIAYHDIGQTWCALYSSPTCNSIFKSASYILKSSQDYVGKEWEDQIRSVQCFRSPVPEVLASASGIVKFSADGRAMGEVGAGSNTLRTSNIQTGVDECTKDAPSVFGPAKVARELVRDQQGGEECITLYPEQNYNGKRHWYMGEDQMNLTNGNYCAYLPADASISSIKKGKCAYWCAVFIDDVPDCNILVHQHWRIVGDLPILPELMDNQLTHFRCFNTPYRPEEHGTLGIAVN